MAAEWFIAAPDCGMKYMPGRTALGKLRAMCDAAATLREEIAILPQIPAPP